MSTSEAPYYRIIEWSTYQHYRDRCPPWIKLHRDTLTSRTWVSGDDASRVLAVACMLIAADTDNKIPADPDFLRRRAYLGYTPDFEPLVKLGFIELCNAANAVSDASKTTQTLALADASKPYPETEERERESRAEAESPPSVPPRGATKRGTRLPDGWEPDVAFAESAGLSRREVFSEAAKFRDYWLAKPGQGGVKLDWMATWRNWVRKAADDRTKRGARQPDDRWHAFQ